MADNTAKDMAKNMAKNPLKLAQQCADTMRANDGCVDTLGVTVHPITTPGEATCTMVVDTTKTNGYDMCFGGFIFSLADLAFAYACNAYNQITVAQHCTITFVRPAFTGDTLTAHARECSRGNRHGIYDITITDQHDKIIAEFRGCSSATAKPIIT